LNISDCGLEYPPWVEALINREGVVASPEERMRLAIRIARESVDNGGGPFGSVITEESGTLVSIGYNSVMLEHDSTAHAEVMAIRIAERMFSTHDLGHDGLPRLELYSSCAPCMMCFGVIWWSGIKKVYAAANKDDAESIGFKEGLVTMEMWDEIRKKKGVEYIANFCRDEEALRPFEKFKERGMLY